MYSLGYFQSLWLLAVIMAGGHTNFENKTPYATPTSTSHHDVAVNKNPCFQNKKWTLVIISFVLSRVQSSSFSISKFKSASPLFSGYISVERRCSIGLVDDFFYFTILGSPKTLSLLSPIWFFEINKSRKFPIRSWWTDFKSRMMRPWNQRGYFGGGSGCNPSLALASGEYSVGGYAGFFARHLSLHVFTRFHTSWPYDLFLNHINFLLSYLFRSSLLIPLSLRRYFCIGSPESLPIFALGTVSMAKTQLLCAADFYYLMLSHGVFLSCRFCVTFTSVLRRLCWFRALVTSSFITTQGNLIFLCGSDALKLNSLNCIMPRGD